MTEQNRRTVLLVVFFLGTACVCLHAQPETRHGLHYKTPATVWDEAMPLGNGLLGALVWGDGKPLKISLDRTDLWDLRPVPQFHTEDYSYKTMRQWVSEGRIEDLHRLYDDPYGNPGPTKIPAGRIELTVGDKIFENASLDLAGATATVDFQGEACAQVFVHAEKTVGVILIESAGPVSVELLAPPFAGQVTDEAGPGKISAGDLASLRYEAPVRRRGDNWTGYIQQGWGGFKFAVVVAWKTTGSKHGSRRSQTTTSPLSAGLLRQPPSWPRSWARPTMRGAGAPCWPRCPNSPSTLSAGRCWSPKTVRSQLPTAISRI